MSGKAFGKGGKGSAPPVRALVRPGFAEAPRQESERKTELIADVKNLQRTDPENKRKWEVFCLKQGVSKLDPAFHDETFLSSFIAQLADGEIEVIESEEKIQLVLKVKAAQRSSPEMKQSWYDYVALAGSAHYDPNRHDEPFLSGFFTFLDTGKAPLNEKEKQRANKIFVGGLDKESVDEEALMHHFSQFGPVTKVELKYDDKGFRGFGFVTFESVDVAQKVIDNGEANEFQGKRIDCKSAQTPPAATSSVAPAKGGSKGAKPASKGAIPARGAASRDSWGGNGGWDEEWGSSGWDDWDWDSMMQWMATMMAMKGKGKGKEGFSGKGEPAAEAYGKSAYGKDSHSKDGPYGKVGKGGKSGKPDAGKGKGKSPGKAVARPAPVEGNHPPTAETIFVGGLPVDVTKEDLFEYFSQFGFVKAAHLKYDQEGAFRGFAFVTFNDADSANAVLANHEFNMVNGKWIDCKLAGPAPVYPNPVPRTAVSRVLAIHDAPAKEKVRSQGEKRTTPAPTNNAIRLRGMPFSTTEMDVIDFFDGYGLTGQVVMKQAPDGRPAGECFVEFADVVEARRAHEDLNYTSMGSRYVEILGATPEDAYAAFGEMSSSLPEPTAAPSSSKGAGKASMRTLPRSSPYGK